MRFEQSKDACWDKPGFIAWQVSQRYKGHKVASIGVVAEELPRQAKARLLLEMRRKVRVIIGRADRKFKQAQARNQ